MNSMPSYTEKDKLRSYSLVFSRSVFTDILLYGDFSRLDLLIERYGISKYVHTYWDFIRFIYRTIRKHYRNEYVYKNEFLTQLLINNYGTNNTIAINEFRVVHSIVDIALFNGESKAFEIKTEYDTPKRLNGQLLDYSRIFEKCYIIIPEQHLKQYLQTLSEEVGVIILNDNAHNVLMEEYRPASSNDILDVDSLMKSIRTQEYKNIILEYYGSLPKVSCFQMFDVCSSLLKEIPQDILRKLLLSEIKKRETVTPDLRKVPFELRQICLSLKMGLQEAMAVKEKLNRIIIT